MALTLSLTGRKVVVLGGTSGIGFAVARAAAEHGAEVVVASSNAERVEQAVAQLPPGARGHRVDLTEEDQIRDLFEQVGEFDHLAYTAGDYLPFKPIGELSLKEARECFEVRFWGAFTAAKYGAPAVRPGGSFVFTSGIIVARPAPNLSATVSSATAVEGLTKELAVELAPVRVNAVRLGPIGRKPKEGTEPDEEHKALYKAVSEKLLTKRMGRPEEAALAYLYLFENGFSTGTVLPAEGGYTLV